MLKKISKISVLTVITALFVFAFAGAAFAEETDETTTSRPIQLDGPELPVGGWAPAEAIYVPEDSAILGGGNSGKIKSSKNKINADPDNVFTKGAATTGYEALDVGQKELYTAINKAAVSFMNAESDLKSRTFELEEGDKERYPIDEIDYTGFGIEVNEEKGETLQEEALKAFYAYQYDHPGYYWISNEVLFNNTTIFPCTEPEYAEVDVRSTINKLIIDSVMAYKALTKNETDRLEKVAIVHDKIVSEIDYAYDDKGNPHPAKWAHSVHGVFDPNIKLAVCEGYADAFALIMNYLEIPNYYIVGDAGAGGDSGHAWNAFYDDADERYLYMDLTWDDLGKNEEGEDEGYSYAYFGMPMTDFEKTHREYESTATEGKNWLYDIPGTYNDDVIGTYYVRGGFYYDSDTNDDAYALATTVKTKAAHVGGCVSVLCPDSDSGDAITDALGAEEGFYSVKYMNRDYRYITGSVFTPTYTWTADNSQVAAFRITSLGWDTTPDTETVDVAVADKVDPTCTKNGLVVYSATFANSAFSVDPRKVTLKALGHSWNVPIYQWSLDNREVTASRMCAREGCTETETEMAKTTAKITRAATYTAKGQTTYTAAFANPVFKAQAKTVTNIPMLAKKANPMKVKATAKTVKVKTLKKKALTVVPLKVTSAKGKVTYKVVGGNAKSKKALKLNAKTGKVTVKKKTKKGKYQIKVKVTAVGATAYKALSRTVKVTINAK